MRFSNRTALLRWLDLYVGSAICWILTTIESLVRRIRRTHTPAPCRSILFIKLAEQGSTVLAYEAILQAVRLVGRDQVYFLVFEENRHILDVLQVVPEQNILTIRTHNLLVLVISFIKRLTQLSKVRVDACIDLEFFARSTAAISWFCRAPYRVGFLSRKRGAYRGDLLTLPVAFDHEAHTTRSFLSLVFALRKKLSHLDLLSANARLDPRFDFVPYGSEEIHLRELLFSLGAIEGEPLVLLNANAGDLLPQRKWSDINYILLARKLLWKWPKALVLFTGSKKETNEIDALVHTVGSFRCKSVVGRTNLRELLTLYSMADVLVTNDSGPAHFATLTEISVLTLFGPETPALFAAQSPRNHVLWARLPCSPCVNAFNQRQTTCRDNLCMQSISVDLVYAKVVGILQEKRRHVYV